MNKYSDEYLNRFVECPCCKRIVKQGQMMCRLPMCADCFRTQENEESEGEG